VEIEWPNKAFAFLITKQATNEDKANGTIRAMI